MDVKLPLTLTPPVQASQDGGLKLQLNQLLEAKVIDTQLMLNTLTLQVADRSVTVQSPSVLELSAGQSLSLRVVKLMPNAEFEIVPSAPGNREAPASPSTKLDGLILRMTVPLPPASTSAASSAAALATLNTGQPLLAKVISLSADKMNVQLMPSNPGSSIATANLIPQTANPILSLNLNQLQFNQLNDCPAALSTNNPALFPEGNHPEVGASATPSSPKTGGSALSPLLIGETVVLQCTKPGATPSLTVSLPALGDEQRIREALKQLLPMQTSPALLLNHLLQIQANVDPEASVADTLKRLAQDILRSIPLREHLTEPARLKQAVDQSGLFLESKLAALLSGKPEISLADDLKLKLNKLLDLVNQQSNTATDTPQQRDDTLLKEGLAKLHGALAKLTLDQLNSLPKDESVKQGWILELPFLEQQLADSIELQIERDQTGDAEQRQKNWAVSITITPPELATIHCRVSCYDGSINTRFWSDSADAVDKINSHLDYLRQQFEQKGLTTGFMDAQQGQPNATDNTKPTLTNLLSVKA